MDRRGFYEPSRCEHGMGVADSERPGPPAPPPDLLGPWGAHWFATVSTAPSTHKDSR